MKDIRRATRRQFSSEEKIRVVVEGLRGEDSIAELCRSEGIAASMYYGWSKEFLEAGKKRLSGDTKGIGADEGYCTHDGEGVAEKLAGSSHSTATGTDPENQHLIDQLITMFLATLMASFRLRAEPEMRQSNHCPPLTGLSSDPVLHGVARGLAEMFPPVELSLSDEETGEEINEDDDLEQVA